MGGALRSLRAARRVGARPDSASPTRGTAFAERMARPLPVLPPALRRPDAQAAAPGGDRRLPGGDADQPQQPRARRRAGDERAGGRGRRRARGDVRPAPARARAPDLERDDRQPRGAVGRARARARAARRALRRRPLHARAHVPACSASRRRPSPPTPTGASTSTRSRRECARGDVGTVVLTPGTTGLGAVDRIDEALALRERHGVRLHVDGAYGGFFALLARGPQPLVDPAPFAAIALCDSVVVDPHKHGLQPYGCGAVLFARSRRRAPVPPRLALHLLHLRRPAPRRDLAGVLARGRRRRRAVADPAGAAARAR